MVRRLPPHVERNHVKGKTYLSFRLGKGPRTRLPENPTSQAFKDAYSACLRGESPEPRTAITVDPAYSIGALITSYKRSAGYLNLRDTSKAGYQTRLEAIREAHGGRAVAGLNRERIITVIMQPLADRPGAALDTLKKLRILIRHAIDIGWLKHDPSLGIKRPKGKKMRAWTKEELAAFESRWRLGTKQRTAYALMRYVGTARVDVHLMTWGQIDGGVANYTRSKSGVDVSVGIHNELQAALAATPRKHVTIINTEYGRPFTVNGFSTFMRNAMNAAGLPLDCKPHGLRKVLGKTLADVQASSHDIRAALGHITTAESDRYTIEADRRRGGRRAIELLNAQKANAIAQTTSSSLGRPQKRKGNQSED